MIIERLSQEHRNIEKLLAILERELEVFNHGDRPDLKVIRAVISYFEPYPEVYHHPQEDLVFAKLEIRDPAAAAKVGDLAREHQRGAERLRRVAHAVDSVLAGREILQQDVDTIVRDEADRFKSWTRPDRKTPGYRVRKPWQPRRIFYRGWRRRHSGSLIRRVEPPAGFVPAQLRR